MTTKDVAQLLGVPYQAAYGLLTFMVAAGLISNQPAVKQPGQKGKPAVLWQLDKGAIDKMSAFLHGKVQA
jgi:predicted ArsR family transcriptional regulator